MKPYKVLLFDIGGVLVRLNGIPRMQELTHRRYTVPQLWEKWIWSPTIRRYESGNMTTGEFGKAIIDEFGMEIAPEQYLREFALWPTEKYSGVNELLATLRERYVIASLSNTNELHWNRIVGEMDFIHLFHHNFPSHLTTHLKPDADAYRHVADTLGVPPGAILFFDDNEINVRGARTIGYDAARVDGVDGVREFLAGQGIAA